MIRTTFILILLLLTNCSASESQWKFIVTGDSRGVENDANGVNIIILSELSAEITKQGVDFVLFPGDLVKGYTDQLMLESQLKTWRRIMKPVYAAGIGVYPIRGNHDVGQPPATDAWNKVFEGLPDNGPADEKNLTYSFTHKNALFIALDQYVTPHRVNQGWLDNQFAENTTPHVFVYGHEPAFKIDYSKTLDEYPDARDRFWKSIENADGRVYFACHGHYYDHSRIGNDKQTDNDIHQYIIGTSGAPLYDLWDNYEPNNSDYIVENLYHVKQFGYVLVEIDGLNVTLTWMERTAAGKYEAGDKWSYVVIPQQKKSTQISRRER